MGNLERTIDMQCNHCGFIATIPAYQWENPRYFVCQHCIEYKDSPLSQIGYIGNYCPWCGQRLKK